MIEYFRKICISIEKLRLFENIKTCWGNEIYFGEIRVIRV